MQESFQETRVIYYDENVSFEAFVQTGLVLGKQGLDHTGLHGHGITGDRREKQGRQGKQNPTHGFGV